MKNKAIKTIYRKVKSNSLIGVILVMCIIFTGASRAQRSDVNNSDLNYVPNIIIDGLKDELYDPQHCYNMPAGTDYQVSSRNTLDASATLYYYVDDAYLYLYTAVNVNSNAELQSRDGIVLFIDPDPSKNLSSGGLIQAIGTDQGDLGIYYYLQDNRVDYYFGANKGAEHNIQKTVLPNGRTEYAAEFKIPRPQNEKFFQLGYIVVKYDEIANSLYQVLNIKKSNVDSSLYTNMVKIDYLDPIVIDGLKDKNYVNTKRFCLTEGSTYQIDENAYHADTDLYYEWDDSNVYLFVTTTATGIPADSPSQIRLFVDTDPSVNKGLDNMSAALDLGTQSEVGFLFTMAAGNASVTPIGTKAKGSQYAAGTPIELSSGKYTYTFEISVPRPSFLETFFQFGLEQRDGTRTVYNIAKEAAAPDSYTTATKVYAFYTPMSFLNFLYKTYEWDSTLTNKNNGLVKGGPVAVKTKQPWFLTSNNPDLNKGERYYTNIKGPKSTKMSNYVHTPEISLNNLKGLVKKLTQNCEPKKSDLDMYQIHEDGGMIFNPIYQEAVKTGILKKYSKAYLTKGTLKVGTSTLTYQVPKNATAYDTVPIKYTLTSSSEERLPIHVEADASEIRSRVKGGQYFDLNLPGHCELKIDYLGYVNGTYDLTKRPIISVSESDMIEAFRVARIAALSGKGTDMYEATGETPLNKNVRILCGKISGLHTVFLRNVDAGTRSVKGIRLLKRDGTYTEVLCDDTWSIQEGAAVNSGTLINNFTNGSIIRIPGVDFEGDIYDSVSVLMSGDTGAEAGKSIDVYLDDLPKDFSEESEGTAYPNADLTELTLSSKVPSADLTWFKIRYTNTGNTILDGDGNGYTQFNPVLEKLNTVTNKWETVARGRNLFLTIQDQLYPGESRETWLIYYNSNPPVGRYRLALDCTVNNTEADNANGYSTYYPSRSFQSSYFEFDVVAPDTGGSEDPNADYTFSNERILEAVGRNQWLHTFEEFMGAYDTWHQPRDGEVYEGVLYLQVAPWTEDVTLRLINEATGDIAVARAPINVNSDCIKINFNPNNNNYIVQNGKRMPLIVSQNMMDMRTSFNNGPNADEVIVNQLIDMQECGINALASTNGFFYDNPNTELGMSWNSATDAFKFSIDAARVMDIRSLGYMCYPYHNRSYSVSQALGEQVELLQEDRGVGSLGFSDPILEVGHAARAWTTYNRWGDTYYKDLSGNIPLAAEDTRGRRAITLNYRYAIGDLGLTKFQEFLVEVYDTIGNLNKDWGTSYKLFSEIDPEKDGVPDTSGHTAYVYLDSNGVFKEWSKPMRVFDIFRTVERVTSYKKIVSMLEPNVPNAAIFQSHENDVWLVSGIDPQSTHQRYRYNYLGSQLGALIPEIIQASGIVTAHSDYNGEVAYRPSEAFDLCAREVATGINPMWLGRFNSVKDYAPNIKYGSDVTVLYNTKTPTKEVSINTLGSAFLRWTAMYEAGGAPGVLWNDYTTAGVVYATQQKEMKFFVKKLKEALNTPEGIAWQNLGGDDKTGVEGKWSYDETYVRAVVDKVKAGRVEGQIPH